MEFEDARDAAAIDAWLPDLLHLTHARAPQITRDFLDGRKNQLTKDAYHRILKSFLLWAERAELESLATLTTSDASNYVKGLQGKSGAAVRTDAVLSTVKNVTPSEL